MKGGKAVLAIRYRRGSGVGKSEGGNFPKIMKPALMTRPERRYLSQHVRKHDRDVGGGGER